MDSWYGLKYKGTLFPNIQNGDPLKAPRFTALSSVCAPATPAILRTRHPRWQPAARLLRCQPATFRNPVRGLLGDLWVVIRGVISPLIVQVIILVILLTTLLIATHEPKSRHAGSGA